MNNFSPAAPSAKAVVLYSGGMDSYTVLHHALRHGYFVHTLSFDYGQRHAKELDIARRICQRLNIAHQVIDIQAIHSLIDNSALTDAGRSLPTGDYDADSLAATVVPNRNMILLSLAIAHAVNIDADVCFYGAQAAITCYPDCRPEFVERMNAASAVANFNAVRIEAPYLYASKAGILADGLGMGLDYAETWTCYQGSEHACGKCGSCRERLAAFAKQRSHRPADLSQRIDGALRCITSRKPSTRSRVRVRVPDGPASSVDSPAATCGRAAKSTGQRQRLPLLRYGLYRQSMAKNGGRFADVDALAYAPRDALWPYTRRRQPRPYCGVHGRRAAAATRCVLLIKAHAGARGFEVAVETNGSVASVTRPRLVCVSPKGVPTYAWVIDSGDELKLVHPAAPTRLHRASRRISASGISTYSQWIPRVIASSRPADGSARCGPRLLPE